LSLFLIASGNTCACFSKWRKQVVELQEGGYKIKYKRTTNSPSLHFIIRNPQLVKAFQENEITDRSSPRG